jgi:hypothetical protein
MARRDIRRAARNGTAPRSNQNAWTEDARLNRCANFRLRLALGMLARVRHTACLGAHGRAIAARTNTPKGLRTDMR